MQLRIGVDVGGNVAPTSSCKSVETILTVHYRRYQYRWRSNRCFAYLRADTRSTRSFQGTYHSQCLGRYRGSGPQDLTARKCGHSIRDLLFEHRHDCVRECSLRGRRQAVVESRRDSFVRPLHAPMSSLHRFSETPEEFNRRLHWIC